MLTLDLSRILLGCPIVFIFFPFPVVFWAFKHNGLLLGKLLSKMNGNWTSSYCQIEYRVPVFSLPPLGA